MILLVIFIPPLYFILRKKYVAAVINFCLLVLALFTIAIMGLGIIFYVAAVLHAGWDYQQVKTVEHAELLATKMAEKMKAK